MPIFGPTCSTYGAFASLAAPRCLDSVCQPQWVEISYGTFETYTHGDMLRCPSLSYEQRLSGRRGLSCPSVISLAARLRLRHGPDWASRVAPSFARIFTIFVTQTYMFMFLFHVCWCGASCAVDGFMLPCNSSEHCRLRIRGTQKGREDSRRSNKFCYRLKIKSLRLRSSFRAGGI